MTIFLPSALAKSICRLLVRGDDEGALVYKKTLKSVLHPERDEVVVLGEKTRRVEDHVFREERPRPWNERRRSELGEGVVFPVGGMYVVTGLRAAIVPHYERRI